MGMAATRNRHSSPAVSQIWRRWLVGLLLAALLAPILTGALSRPALSAEPGLDEALRLSLCSTPGERDADGGQTHDGQCQLCVLGCGICCAAPVADLPSTPSDHPRASPRRILATAPQPIQVLPPGRPLQPRAPPASLT